MAFNDIQAWRDMMDAQDSEREAYEKACEDAERRAAELDKREYDEIDQEPVGAECACGCEAPGCTCLDDLEDDEVDFSAYGIDEADLGVGPADENYATLGDIAREPLVRLPAAIGRPVSDADLVSQNVVQVVAEAVKKIINGEKSKSLYEDFEFEESEDEFDAVEPQPEPEQKAQPEPEQIGESGDVVADARSRSLGGISDAAVRKFGGRDEFFDAVEAVREAGSKDGDDYYFFDFDDGRTLIVKKFKAGSSYGYNAVTREPEPKRDAQERAKAMGLGRLDEDEKAPKADEKIEQMAADDDYPLSDDDWKEILAEPDYGKKLQMIQGKVADRWDGLSADAKRRIKDDVMELRKDMLQSKWSEAQFKKALRYQQISRNRDLTDKEFQDFTEIVQFGLTDEQRGKLYRNVVSNGYMVPQAGRTTVVPHSNAQAGNKGEAFAGVNADERRNETGLDSTFDPEQFEYVPEPMEPGTRVPADFNPDYAGSHNAADVRELAAQLLPGHKDRVKQWKRDDYADWYERQPGDYSINLAGHTKFWKDIVKNLDPDEVEEIENELRRELPFRKDETDTLLNCMFHTFKITRQDQMRFWGVGGDQKGNSGMGTQNWDKLTNVLLISLAIYLNICQDPVQMTVRKTGGGEKSMSFPSEIEAFKANLRSENTEQREARKELRVKFLDEICAELGVDRDALAADFGAKPTYAGGRKEKDAANQLVMTLFVREWDNSMTAADKEAVHDFFRWYESGTQKRKLNTGLNAEENNEYQELIQKMRDENDLPDDLRYRLLQLDLLRSGKAQNMADADAKAQQKRRELDDKGPGEFVDYTTDIAHRFVRGQSQNHWKDTISDPARSARSMRAAAAR